jgi:hypothetical protein
LLERGDVLDEELFANWWCLGCRHGDTVWVAALLFKRFE